LNYSCTVISRGSVYRTYIVANKTRILVIKMNA
jgi:hypothetical protein